MSGRGGMRRIRRVQREGQEVIVMFLIGDVPECRLIMIGQYICRLRNGKMANGKKGGGVSPLGQKMLLWGKAIQAQ
jgi:hypothetical protein